MNNQLITNITNFMARVADYIYMEYGDDFHKQYISYDPQYIYDFTGSYYLGGNNVPDTARYVVEFLKMSNRA